MRTYRGVQTKDPKKSPEAKLLTPEANLTTWWYFLLLKKHLGLETGLPAAKKSFAQVDLN